MHTIYRAATYIYIVSCKIVCKQSENNSPQPISFHVLLYATEYTRLCFFPPILPSEAATAVEYPKNAQLYIAEYIYILGVLIAIYVVHTGGAPGTRRRGQCVRFALSSQLYLCHMDFSANYFWWYWLELKAKTLQSLYSSYAHVCVRVCGKRRLK